MSTHPCSRAEADPSARPVEAGPYANTLRHFGSYRDARADFLAQAHRADARIRRYIHPNFPDLSTDVAVLPGELGRTAALVLVSGTHGIEGHAGSAIQRQLLREAAQSREIDTILIHGLNPHGFAHNRRVDENNVDVNRNFVDFRQPPANADYAVVHDLLVPDDWNGPAHRRAQSALSSLLQVWGPARVQSAVTHGQYICPDGLFFGGDRPSWSRETLCEIVSEYVVGHTQVAYIDLHTGLGEPGLGEPIFRGGTDPQAFDRCRRWYGDSVTSSEDGTSSSTPIEGNTAAAVAALVQGSGALTSITLEFGTRAPQAVLTALQGDNWFHLRRRRGHPDYAPVAEAMAAAFAPTDPGWQQRMISRGAEVIGQAERGLLGATSRSAGALTTQSSTQSN
jgi:hypothetical protein